VTEVSRADIRTDVIMDFPSRFLKIPIKPYLELIDIEPLPSQIGLINAVNNPKYRFICGALSRRQGKTFIANVIGQLVSLVPGSQVLIMSPNYSLSQISFDLQRSLIRKFDLEVTRDNAKDKIIELQNGSTIRMGSINQVDSCVGRSYDLIIFDEAALSDGMDAFNVALRPTLDKPNSKAIFISTPRGRNNWFSELYARGFSEDFPAWASIKATYHDNPRTSEADIAEARKSMTKAEFEQEYMASFTTYEGQIWNFDAERDVRDLSGLDYSRMDIIGGIDVGFRDPTAFCVIAYDWDTENYYCIDEYMKAEGTTEEHATVIKRMVDRHGVDLIYIDAAAQQTRFDLAQNYDISTNNAKKSILDGIAAVGVLVDNGRLIVDPRCKQVIASLDSYQWEQNMGQKEKPKHNDACHMADALRYAIYSYTVSSSAF
jgi:phage terminase large subunit